MRLNTLPNHTPSNIADAIARIVQQSPMHERVAIELLQNKHPWAQVDIVNEELRLRYILIPADPSRFENPGEGVNWYALDDDTLKIEGVDPIQFLSRSNLDLATKTVTKLGVEKEPKGLCKVNGIKILAVNFYDMIGSQEQINWQEDRQAYVLLLRRSATGMPRRNSICVGLLVNSQRYGREDFKIDTNEFDITDFDPESSCRDDALFPATIVSTQFGLVQVINIKACLEAYEPVFRKKFPFARQYYPYFGKPAQ